MTEITLEEIKKINKSDMSAESYLKLPWIRVKILGHLPAILLQFLLYKEEYFEEKKLLTDDGFFYNTMDDIYEKTFLSRRNQETSLKELVELNLIETRMAGNPAKKYYKINHLVIFNLFHTERSSLYEPSEQVCTNRATTNKAFTNDTNTSSPKKSLLRKKMIVKRNILKHGYKETVVQNKADKEEKEKEKLQRDVTFDMQVVIDYWSGKGLMLHKEGTKTYALAMDRLQSLLKGKLFNSFKDKSNHNRKFSMEEIKRAINNFSLAAFNEDYEPKNKKFLQGIKFVDFFYSSFPYPKEEDKSMFLKQLLGKPRLVKDNQLYSAKDTNPEATKILTTWYKKTFADRSSNFSLKNRNDLVYSVKEITKFYNDFSSRLLLDNWKTTYNQHDPICFLALQLTRAFDKILRENENLFITFTTGWLKSEKTFNERLPEFLMSERMMK